MISDRQPGYLPSLLGKRREFIQLACIAVGLSLGVNLLSNAIAASLPVQSTLIVGATTVCFVVVLLAWWTFQSISLSRTIDACIFVGANGELVTPVGAYEFSREVFDALETGLQANPTLRDRWQVQAPLISRQENSSDSIATLWSKDAALGLIRDAVEIVLFDYLSDSLAKTLKLSGADPKLVETRPPSEFPGLTMGNELMVSHAHARTVSITVPVGSVLTRPSSHTLTLHSPRLRLKFAIGYTGENAYIPASVVNLYFEGIRHVRPQLVSIRVRCDVLPAALFQAKSWDQYAWIDEFLRKLDRVDYSRFFLPH